LIGVRANIIGKLQQKKICPCRRD